MKQNDPNREAHLSMSSHALLNVLGTQNCAVPSGDGSREKWIPLEAALFSDHVSCLNHP